MTGAWEGDNRNYTRKAHQEELRLRGTSESTRDRAGCICTLRDEDSGRIVTLQRNGFRLDALRAIAAWCDRTPGDWKLVCYSTAETIQADLQGERTSVMDRQRTTESRLELPELKVLGRIGRFDLVAPELLAHTDPEARRAKNARRSA